MDKEYIDREAASKAVYQYLLEQTVSKYATAEQCNAARGGVSGAMEVLDDVPAADVAHVVHGEWVESPKKYSYYQYRCSVCGFDNYSHITRNGVIKLMKYCPNCGAKMDGGDNGTAQT